METRAREIRVHVLAMSSRGKNHGHLDYHDSDRNQSSQPFAVSSSLAIAQNPVKRLV